MSVIIPAGTPGQGLKSYGPRGLAPLGGETILQREIRLLREIFPSAEYVVVVGEGAEKVLRKVHGIRMVLWEEPEGVARAVEFGLKKARGENSLVVYGDLVWRAEAVSPWLGSLSGCAPSLFLDTGPTSPGDVGVSYCGAAYRMSYGLWPRWGQMAYLTGAEKEGFLSEMGHPRRRLHYTHEVLNDLLGDGWPAGSGCGVLSVSSLGELHSAQQMLSRWEGSHESSL